MVVQARAVPWQSSLEWLDVYKVITCATEDAVKRRVVDQISFWELKSSKVPVAVGCTKLLLQAVLLDSQEKQHIHDVQMMYALAVSRFVNGHVDLQQQKYYAEPITIAASHMGIPCEIVNCRHRITHNDMPSLDLLRHTASLCWEYLLNTYWHPQAKVIQKWCVSSIENSKKLTVALVTLLKKIETLRPPANFDFDSRFYSNLPSSLHHLTKDSILFAAVSLTTLKQKKQILKHVKRLGLPEQLLQNNFFLLLVTWCQLLHEATPHCLHDLESCLKISSKPEFMLSFLKDFVFVVERPNTNCILTLCVFWILAREPPQFVLKLVSSMLQRIGKMNVKELDIPNASSQQHQFFPNCDYTDVDLSNRFESCALWIRAVSSNQELPLEQRMDRVRHLFRNEHEQREILLEWLECLLLVSSNHDENASIRKSETNLSLKLVSVSLPFPVQFILRLYCDRALSKHIAQQKVVSNDHRFAIFQWMSSPRSSSDIVFLKKLLPTFHKVQARVLAICQLYSKPIVMNAFKRLLTLKEDDGCEILVQHRFVNIFNSVNAMLPPESNRLLEWLLTYIKIRQSHQSSLNKSNHSLNLNSQIKSLFQLTSEDFTSFQEQKHLILDAYHNQEGLTSGSEEHDDSSSVQDISSGFELPWTNPESNFQKEETHQPEGNFDNANVYYDPPLQDISHIEHHSSSGERSSSQDEKFSFTKKRKNSSFKEQHYQLKKRRGIPKALLELNKHTSNYSAISYENEIANLQSYIINRIG